MLLKFGVKHSVRKRMERTSKMMKINTRMRKVGTERIIGKRLRATPKVKAAERLQEKRAGRKKQAKEMKAHT